ncbi:MAG: cytochrome b N-terminal domain-containing protein [Magnetococcales bacterium]|nr:cytochrome b N-terminal domain-containing protein [Magnetococcales bacterium]
MKPERYHWRHFFGGVAFVLLFLQFATGLFLTLFYEPNIKEAYASVQYLYKDFPVGAWLRDSHRWIALFMLTALVVHIVRSLLRKDFTLPDGKVTWVTGSLMILPILAFLVTGFILPWEWKGYWWMEIIPNYFGVLPLVGESIKSWLIDFFTMNRAFVAHVLILPVVTLILADFHILMKMRKRKRGGITNYLLRHGLITIPFFVAIAVLALKIPMPTEDPMVIPMPLEGTYIPAAEWFFLIFLVPFMYFKEGLTAPLLGFYLPLFLFLALTLLPFFWKKKKADKEESGESQTAPAKKSIAAKIFATASVIFVTGIVLGGLYWGNHLSPTLGCNSCHNVYLGTRMGIPPETYKDRQKIPVLDDNQWMVEHWFFPQVVW